LKVELTQDVGLKTKAGSILWHKTGDILVVSHKTGSTLLLKKKVKQIFSPPVQFQSKMLGETVWLINDQSQFESLIKRGVEGAIFTSYEYYLLGGMDKKNRNRMLEIKKFFQDSVILDIGAASGINRTESDTEGGDTMKRNDAFPSKYVSKEDLDKPRTWTIREIEMEEIRIEDDRESKPVCYFAEQDSKPLILNTTNWGLIEEFLGEESNNWAGKRIELYRENNVMFGKKKVGGVRVRKPSGMFFDSTRAEKVLSTETSEQVPF